VVDLELLTLNKNKMNLESENSKEPQKQPLLIADVISRLIVYALIWIACYHICHIWLNDNGYWDLLWATLWTGNIFLLKPFAKWMTNGL